MKSLTRNSPEGMETFIPMWLREAKRVFLKSRCIFIDFFQQCPSTMEQTQQQQQQQLNAQKNIRGQRESVVQLHIIADPNNPSSHHQVS